MGDKVLVVGGGGREHALVLALYQSDGVGKVYAAPGNAGTASFAENVDIGDGDIPALRDFASKKSIDLTVVGPEAPLVAGIVDEFQAAGLPVFGPTAAAAQVEGSKVFAKELMLDAGVPTADAYPCETLDDAKRCIAEMGAPVVVKADGLAAGKGVTIAVTEEEAVAAAGAALEEGKFGDSGKRVLIEDYLTGEEASILAVTDGENVVSMIPSQDHKRVYDGDEGPNTGGMGAYAPAPVVDDETLRKIENQVLKPTIKALADAGATYSGALYAGLMFDFEGPKVLEFNCRFGDPETQVVLPLLKSDFYELCAKTAAGNLRDTELEWNRRAAVTVVTVSGGYPGEYKKGFPISGLDALVDDPDIIVYHAGTKLDGDKVVTAGGRVLGVTAIGGDIAKAVKKAYTAVRKIDYKDIYYRKDIAYKALARNDEGDV
ncbi:MAG: phosphoribosylamine--glycine ligase [Candidatus Coatesbacteria bacterium]|nr:MAG: phosphoribosylamine--glycine ligase [Candidatus Coatesbacteria bacterium]